MKQPIVALLYCCSLLLALPAKSMAAFYIPARPAVQNIRAPHFVENRRYDHPHMHHFQGARHDFCGTFGLVCSILGSVAVIATFVAAIALAPTVAFVLAAFGCSILGITLGCISHSDSSGDKAVLIGVVNLLALWLGGAIYRATLGDFVPLMKFVKIFL